MNREKSEAKCICIPDCHAFKMDLWCGNHISQHAMEKLHSTPKKNISCAGKMEDS
jgi:hypothetical protein